MSQFSSPQPPPNDEGAAPAPRRLISPQERFADPAADGVAAPAPLDEMPAKAENPFEAQLSARQRDEMERRHLPPRERARQERARLHVEGAGRRRPAPLPVNYPSASSGSAKSTEAGHRSAEQRGRAERDFARSARLDAPVAAPLSPPRRRRAPRWMKRLLVLVALIFVGQLGFAALTAPQFNIETVEIQGARVTPAEQVQPLARALVGHNLLRLKAGATERAVALIPTIAEAKVVRLVHWPPKVVLQIRERQPVLKVGSGANWWVVDEKGVPFRRSAPADGALYSVVAPQFGPQLRRPLEAKSWARARALELALEADNRAADNRAADNRAADNRADKTVDSVSPVNGVSAGAAKTGDKSTRETTQFWQLRRIYFDRDGLASLRLSNAPHREMLVRLGDEGWPEKLARARQSLAYFERTGRRASELDLVSLERPVWTPVVPQLVLQDPASSGKESTHKTG